MGPVAAEGGTICKATSNIYKGLCLLDDSCDIVCKKEGFHSGNCKGFIRKCVSLIEHVLPNKTTAMLDEIRIPTIPAPTPPSDSYQTQPIEILQSETGLQVAHYQP
ncbi:hypothetical protein Goshw_030513 [Gossypium schwendimanii]|uniref:Knottins-like domain-containing protein n=1 Tax=Gossypium schwendimanii TaxID=34291 RepID=A0A7J9KVM6_GOSSC|nr:hypothetical protein [Gossypium schwendimanii]